jgi:fucose permease
MTGLVMLLPAILYFFIKFPAAKQSQGVSLKEIAKLVKQPAMLLTGFFLFFQSGVEALISNWTTSYLEATIAASPSQALYALSFSIVGLTVGRLLLGALMKRISSFVIMLVSLFLVVVGCIILAITRDYSIAFGALIVIGAGFAGGFPVILGYIGQLYASLSGTAFSIALVIALIGNILINLSFGAIVRRYSIEYLPFAVMTFIICMIVVLFLIKREIQNKIKL